MEASRKLAWLEGVLVGRISVLVEEAGKRGLHDHESGRLAAFRDILADLREAA
jgi:hypothetical protein